MKLEVGQQVIISSKKNGFTRAGGKYDVVRLSNVTYEGMEIYHLRRDYDGYRISLNEKVCDEVIIEVIDKVEY